MAKQLQTIGIDILSGKEVQFRNSLFLLLSSYHKKGEIKESIVKVFLESIEFKDIQFDFFFNNKSIWREVKKTIRFCQFPYEYPISTEKINFPCISKITKFELFIYIIIDNSRAVLNNKGIIDTKNFSSILTEYSLLLFLITGNYSEVSKEYQDVEQFIKKLSNFFDKQNPKNSIIEIYKYVGKINPKLTQYAKCLITGYICGRINILLPEERYIRPTPYREYLKTSVQNIITTKK